MITLWGLFYIFQRRNCWAITSRTLKRSSAMGLPSTCHGCGMLCNTAAVYKQRWRQNTPQTKVSLWHPDSTMYLLITESFALFSHGISQAHLSELLRTSRRTLPPNFPPEGSSVIGLVPDARVKLLPAVLWSHVDLSIPHFWHITLASFSRTWGRYSVTSPCSH